MGVIKRLKSATRAYSCPVWRVSGTEKAGGLPISVLFYGAIRQNNYLINKLMAPEGVEREYVGRKAMHSVESHLASHDCSLAVMNGSQYVLDRLRQPGDLIVPLWVEAEIDCDRILGGQVSPTLRREIRKIEDRGLTARQAFDDQDIEFFYRQIYLPTIRNSHQDAALPSSIAKRKKMIADGTAELLLVEQDGDRVGGVLLDYRGTIPSLRDTGVLHGDRKYMKQGVITAGNYFSVQHLCRKGFNSISFGLARGFVSDGVFNYKTKYSPRVFCGSEDAFLFRAPRLDDAARSVFRTLDCFTETRHGLALTRFADGKAKADSKDRSGIKYVRGLAAHAWYELSGERPVLAETRLIAENS